eukprot:7391422-Prymnesium_polylepis.3
MPCTAFWHGVLQAWGETCEPLIHSLTLDGQPRRGGSESQCGLQVPTDVRSDRGSAPRFTMSFRAYVMLVKLRSVKRLLATEMTYIFPTNSDAWEANAQFGPSCAVLRAVQGTGEPS